MLPKIGLVRSTNTTEIPSLKIRSPKSDIKVHKSNLFNMSSVSPELAVRASSQTSVKDDSLDRITQASNKFEINVLSKAIAMAQNVKFCSIGPKAVSVVEPDCSRSDLDDSEKPDLGNAVTSTPVKSEQAGTNKLKSVNVSVVENKSYPLDVSEISTVNENNLCIENEEISELRSLRLKCQKELEKQIKMAICKKQDEYLKLWLDNDEKIKEKLLALKIDLDRENLIRLQEHYLQAQKQILETKANAQLKAEEQLQRNKEGHAVRILKTNERIKQIEQQKKELEEKQRQNREELKICINGICDLQISYRQKYNQICDMIKKCKDVRSLNQKVSTEYMKLKQMNEMFLELVDKCREGKVSLKDLKSAEKLDQQINIICKTIMKHTDDINKSIMKAEEEEKRKQLEEEVKAKEEEAELQQKVKEQREKTEKEEKNNETAKLLSGIEDCISRENLKWHFDLSRYLEDFEKKLEPLLTNDSLKIFRLECQKVVNIPVNAISPLDDLHLEDKFYRLSRLLQGQAVPLGDTLFLATGHPLGIPFCTNLLAKKIVKQGERTVASKPEAAFAIAAVVVALWVEFPKFGLLLLAHFHRECPYLIPAFLPQVEGQSDENYYRMLGYQYSEDGKVESQDQFLRRMSGIMRLYAAIFVTELKRSHVKEHEKHPHSMRDAWRWLAATLNLQPRSDISSTLIFDFLEVTGRKLYQTYGSQFTKLLHVLCTDYFRLIKQVTPDECGGPVVRLKIFLEKVLKEGQVPSPAGLLPSNFW